MTDLPSKFSIIQQYFNKINDFSGPHSGSDFASLIDSACTECEYAIRYLNELQLFSNNETLDDLSSEQIKYVILPAVTGYFASNKNSNRKVNVNIAISLYEEFLQLCNSYKISDFRCRETSQKHVEVNGVSTLSQREEKIRRYKEKKAVEHRLEQLANYIDQPHVDDEVKREYYLTLVKKWIYIAEDELPILKMESTLLDHRDKEHEQPKSNGKQEGSVDLPLKRLRPFILTRDAVQATVFGLGYPSIPTMTLEQFYQSQVKLGILPAPADHTEPSTISSEHVRRIDPSEAQHRADEEKAADNDVLCDADDAYQLAKARAWDAYKDEHRRGEGNRMNRA